MKRAILAVCSFSRLFVFIFPAVVFLGGCSSDYVAMERGVRAAHRDGYAVSDDEKEPITRMAFVERNGDQDVVAVVVGGEEVLSRIESAAGAEDSDKPDQALN